MGFASPHPFSQPVSSGVLCTRSKSLGHLAAASQGEAGGRRKEKKEARKEGREGKDWTEWEGKGRKVNEGRGEGRKQERKDGRKGERK